MQMYVILRRGAWADGGALEAAAARSTVEGDAHAGRHPLDS